VTVSKQEFEIIAVESRQGKSLAGPGFSCLNKDVSIANSDNKYKSI
jgi:hypothetical protein